MLSRKKKHEFHFRIYIHQPVAWIEEERTTLMRTMEIKEKSRIKST